MTLIICSLARLPDVIADKRPSHVMSLLSPDLMIEPLAHLPSERHLRLTVHDIHEPTPGMIAPDEAMVASLLRFGRGWDAERPMVVHCLAGVSRSSAAALAIACDRNPAVAADLADETMPKLNVGGNDEATVVRDDQPEAGTQHCRTLEVHGAMTMSEFDAQLARPRCQSGTLPVSQVPRNTAQPCSPSHAPYLSHAQVGPILTRH